MLSERSDMNKWNLSQALCNEIRIKIFLFIEIDIFFPTQHSSDDMLCALWRGRIFF